MKVYANKRLFDRWVGMSICVGALKQAVQNDMDVEPEEVNQFVDRAANVLYEFECLLHDTLEHLKGN